MSGLPNRPYIADADFQGRFITMFAFAMVIGMVASIMLFNHLAISELESLKWRMVIFESTIADVIMPYVVYISMFAAALTFSLLWAVSWYLHRDVIGVIYRLKKDMEDVAGGNLRLRIGLRRADPFKATARELDRVVTKARKRLRGMEYSFREAKRIIDSIGEVREELLPEKCLSLSRKIEDLEKSMRN